MGAIVALLAGIGGVAGLCAVVLVRRGRRGVTENADGLLIEQEARLRAHQARADGRAFRGHPHETPGTRPHRR